jgi:hypothetical protein
MYLNNMLRQYYEKLIKFDWIPIYDSSEKTYEWICLEDKLIFSGLNFENWCITHTKSNSGDLLFHSIVKYYEPLCDTLIKYGIKICTFKNSGFACK